MSNKQGVVRHEAYDYYIFLWLFDESTMSVLQRVGQAIMRRNSYFIATIVAGALIGEIMVDSGVNAFWEWKNRGVC